MLIYNYYVGIMFMIGLFMFSYFYSHIFITLLIIEYLVLCVYMYMVMMFNFGMSDTYIILMFLTFSVCEGVLGLSMLIYMIRCFGNDYLNSLSLLW